MPPFTALAVASTAAVLSHNSRVIPNPALSRNSSSRSSRTCPVIRCCTSSQVNALALDRAVATIFAGVTTPGRVVFAEIRYSLANVNNNVGESCSIARSSRNCSRSFIT